MPQSPLSTAQSCPSCGEAVPLVNELQSQIDALQEQITTLNQQVHTDTLTGLYNYRHFTKTLDYEMERTQRTGQATALIIVDLDFFKKVNDTWGHEVGNQALIQTANLLREATRKLDIPCRYGGEEFVIILPSTDLLTGTQVAERLRRLIEATPVRSGDNTIALTASLGIDVYSSASSQEPQETFIKRVDALLYEAKHSGRNQVRSGQRTDIQPENTVSSDEKEALFGLFGNSDNEGNE